MNSTVINNKLKKNTGDFAWISTLVEKKRTFAFNLRLRSLKQRLNFDLPVPKRQTVGKTTRRWQSDELDLNCCDPPPSNARMFYRQTVVTAYWCSIVLLHESLLDFIGWKVAREYIFNGALEDFWERNFLVIRIGTKC